MSLLYYLVLLFLHILFIPFLIFASFKQKYKNSIPARFFLYKNPPFKKDGIHFHACSMGEINTIRPLVNELKKSHNINISVVTNTGYFNAMKLSNNVRYLPFETLIPFWLTPQKTLIVAEAELWYMLFFCAKKRGASTYLVNARLSEKSLLKYMRFRFLYKKIFENIDHTFAQSSDDMERLKRLGATNISVAGNLKLLNIAQATKKYEVDRSKEIITAASTHEGEEEIVLEALTDFKNRRLVVAPRHPERFLQVEKLISDFSHKNSLTYAKLSDDASFTSDITLVDMMGELINIYAISDVVILGGGFVKAGGHNPIEPAHFGCKIISGVNIFYQFPLFEAIENYRLCSQDELKSLLENTDLIEHSYIKEKIDLDRIIKELKL
ncbi:MAG: lipid IV(A) 3-deoxy-D-manno-octulosonic acid transferase [Campylobacterales bacterium]